MGQHNWTNTRITNLLGIEYPIIQGPFGGGLSSVELSSTVSALGGLGSFGCQPYTAAEIIEFANRIKKQTPKPFNLNLWVNDRDERLATFHKEDWEKLKQLFNPYFEELGITFPEMPKELGPTFEDQIDAIFETKPAVFSFVYGIPSESILEKCRRNSIKIVGTATTVKEAIALENAGVDAIVATGFEAGGHRVSFLEPAERSLNGTFSLIAQVVDQVKIPVIAAGGIAEAKGVKAALALGAEAVQIGTAFLATNQSNATAEHKQKLFSEDAKHTVLTKLISGRLGRAIKSRLTEELKHEEHLFAPYPMQRKFMNMLTAALIKNNKTEYTTFWAGQSASLLKHKEAPELFHSIVNGMNELK